MVGITQLGTHQRRPTPSKFRHLGCSPRRILDFSFRFGPRCLSRYSYASIKTTFRKAGDVQDHKIQLKDSSEGPQVGNIASTEAYRLVKTVEQKEAQNVTMPLMFNAQISLSTGLKGTWAQKSGHQNNCQQIHIDDHGEACSVAWELREQKSKRWRHLSFQSRHHHPQSHTTNVKLSVQKFFSCGPSLRIRQDWMTHLPGFSN